MIKKFVSFLLVFNLIFVFHAHTLGIDQDQGDKITHTGQDTLSVQVKNLEPHEIKHQGSEKKEELKSKPAYSTSHVSVNVILLLIYKLIFRKIN